MNEPLLLADPQKQNRSELLIPSEVFHYSELSHYIVRLL